MKNESLPPSLSSPSPPAEDLDRNLFFFFVFFFFFFFLFEENRCLADSIRTSPFSPDFLLDESPFLPSGSFNRSQVGNPIAYSPIPRYRRGPGIAALRSRVRYPLHSPLHTGNIYIYSGKISRGRSSRPRTRIERAKKKERGGGREGLLIGNRTRRKHAVRPEKIKLKRDYTKLGTPR